MQSIEIVKFKAKCRLEGTWGYRDLGELNCSVELWDHGKKLDGYGSADIEFIAGDNVENIGLTYVDEKRIIDYEGVFSVPSEAIALLKKHGFNTDEIE